MGAKARCYRCAKSVEQVDLRVAIRHLAHRVKEVVEQDQSHRPKWGVFDAESVMAILSLTEVKDGSKNRR